MRRGRQSKQVRSRGRKADGWRDGPTGRLTDAYTHAYIEAHVHADMHGSAGS